MKLLATMILLIMLMTSVYSLNIYLSPIGNDSYSCDISNKCLTLNRAIETVKNTYSDVNIYLDSGVYSSVIIPINKTVYIIGQDKSNTIINSTATNCIQTNNSYLYLDNLTIQGCYLGLSSIDSVVEIGNVDINNSSGVFAKNSYINFISGDYTSLIKRNTLGGSGINSINSNVSIGHSVIVGNFSQNVIANYGSSLSISNNKDLNIINDINSTYSVYSFGLRVFNNSTLSNGTNSRIFIDGYNYPSHHNYGIQLMNNSTASLNAYTILNIKNYDFGVAVFNNSVLNTGNELTSLDINSKYGNVTIDYSSILISGHNLNTDFKNAMLYNQPIEDENSRLLGYDFRYLKKSDATDALFERTTLLGFNLLQTKENLGLLVNGFIYVPNDPIVIDNGHSFNMCKDLNTCTEIYKQDYNQHTIYLPDYDGELITKEQIKVDTISRTFNLINSNNQSCYMNYNDWGMLLDSNC